MSWTGGDNDGQIRQKRGQDEYDSSSLGKKHAETQDTQTAALSYCTAAMPRKGRGKVFMLSED